MSQPLGILRSGPAAWVDERGTVELAGRPWTLRWWVAGEDRWHRPDVDAAVRQRLVDETPVAETAIRVPGGDAIGTGYAIAVAGGPVLVGRVANASPVPIAVALVIGPASSIHVDGTTVVVDGATAVELSRRPSASVAAASLDELAVAVAGATTVAGRMSGYAAVVVPLPHTQVCSWHVADPGVEVAGVPEPQQVASGWTRHADEGAQLSLPGPEAIRFARARHIVALGPSPAASLAEVAAHVAASLRLGWFDAALDGTDRLAAAQRTRGRVGEDEATTIAALDALASWRRAGIPADGLDHLVGPVAAAAGWLLRRRRRLDPALRDRAASALRGAAAFLEATGQAEAAVPVRQATAAVSSGAVGTDPVEIGAPESAPALIAATIDGCVSDDDGGVALLSAWAPSWGREPVEASAVPTAWGLASFALRWHGRRPALLWEIDRWPDVERDEPHLTAPSLDPAWTGRGWRGEALLSEPDALDALDAPVGSDESFS